MFLSLANQYVFQLGVYHIFFMRTRDGSRKGTNNIPTLPQRGRVGLDFYITWIRFLWHAMMPQSYWTLSW